MARFPDQPRFATVSRPTRAGYHHALAVVALLLGGVTALRGADAGWLDWLNPELRRLERERASVVQELEQLGIPSVGQTVDQFGYQHPFRSRPSATPAWVHIDLGQSRSIDSVVLVPARANWQPYDQTAYGFPLRLRIELSDDPEFTRRVTFGSFTDRDIPSPGVAPMMVAAQGPAKARYVRISVTKMAFENERYFYALAEIMVLAGNVNVAIGRKVQASEFSRSSSWRPNFLVDGRTPLGPPIRTESVARDGFYIKPEEGVRPMIVFDLGRVYALQQLRLHPVHARRFIDVPGAAFPQALHIEASVTADFAKPLHLYRSSRYTNPGNNPFMISGREIAARYVRMEAREATPKGAVGFSEIEIYAEGRNVARGAKITATPDRADRPQRWPESLLNDGFTSYGRLLELPEWIREWDRRRALKAALVRIEREEIAAAALTRQRALWLASGAALMGVAAVAGLLVASKHKRRRDLQELRARLARDLHDEIGSNLASITMLSEAAAAERADTARDRADWAEVRQVAQETTGAMHEVLWLIGGREEAGADLATNLKLAASRMLGGLEMKWHGSLKALPVDWPAESKRQVYLFFKEALANVVRHSRATRVDLSAQAADGRLRIGVVDNGIGFDRERVQSGIGLASQRQRARVLGGTLDIESEAGRGTRVRLDLPLAGKPARFSFLHRKPISHEGVKPDVPGLAH